MRNYSIIQKSQLEGAIRLDAEYYQPEYLELINEIQKFPGGFQSLKEMGCKIVSGPFGSSLKSDAYFEKGIPFIRIVNLQEFFIDETDIVCISPKDNDRLKQSQLLPGDLVLSKVGHTIGTVSAIPKEFKKCNISENNIGIKFIGRTITDEQKTYILAFLNSKVGFKQIIRNISGNAQPKLNIEDVYHVICPMPSEKMLHEINNLIIEARSWVENSKSLYSQAENLLLEELGLNEFKIKGEIANVVKFLEVKEAGRMDAEYFQVKYEILIAKIMERGARHLNELVSMKKGFEPGSESYQDEGNIFIRVSSLSKNGLEEKDQKYLNDEMYQQLRGDYEPKIGEILLTKDATPGIAYYLKEKIEGIISSGIMRLKLIEKKNVDPEYLALCINSLIGQMQIERDAGGSIIMHLKPKQIKELLIPILPEKTQQKIADLVRRSHEAREKAKELLEEAKRKVEEMIEKGTK